VYMPGVKLGALYSPASSATKFLATPVCELVTVTMAPAITPPVWSVTVPKRRPVLIWENSGRPISITAKPTTTTTPIILLENTRAHRQATTLRLFIGKHPSHRVKLSGVIFHRLLY